MINWKGLGLGWGFRVRVRARLRERVWYQFIIYDVPACFTLYRWPSFCILRSAFCVLRSAKYPCRRTYEPTEKLALQIHSWQVMLIYSKQCVIHCFGIFISVVSNIQKFFVLVYFVCHTPQFKMLVSTFQSEIWINFNTVLEDFCLSLSWKHGFSQNENHAKVQSKTNKYCKFHVDPTRWRLSKSRF